MADLHFSHDVPKARGETREEWYVSMKRYVGQLKNIAGNLPIVCAGDVFDSWDQPAELVNFLIRKLPVVYTVPGNHDLPGHSPGQIHRSAYWTLAEAGKIVHLNPSIPHILRGNKIELNGFGCGSASQLYPIRPAKNWEKTLRVAVVHEYIWMYGHCHPGAKREDHVEVFKKKVEGYDAVIVGDNHSHFIEHGLTDYRPWVYNCGNFMNRRSDERNNRPGVGILYSDGSFTRREFDTSFDKWNEVPEKEPESKIDAEELMKTLNELAEVGIDFAKAVVRRFEELGCKESVKKFAKRVIEEAREKP